MADYVLRRFTDGNGEFTLALSKDVRGLLSLHDMSHLDMGVETSLHKAKEFSSKHLASAIRHLEPGLARYVRQSLDHPGPKPATRGVNGSRLKFLRNSNRQPMS